MTNRISLDIERLRSAYRSGTETPVGVAKEIQDRITRAGEDGVWITRRTPDDVLQDAHTLAARSDKDSLPLYGIPFAVKDNIDAAGLPTTAACPDFAYEPTRSATVVDKLVAAGALLIGKTNLDQFAAGLVGTRSPYGVARNPFDPAMPPGGSSSGSAVAVASGLVSFALGTDTAGSGRVPASFNNIVGLKPTRGLLSTRGVVPACRSLDCVSVFALTVEDAVTVTAAMAGFDAEDAYSRPAPPLFDLRVPPWRGAFRFGVLSREHRVFFGDMEAEALYDEAIAKAVGAGGSPVEIDFTPWIEVSRLLYGPWAAERAAVLEELLRTRPEALHPVTRAVIAPGLQVSAVELFRAQYRLQALAQAIAEVWHRIDFMLLPTTGTAFTLEQIEQDPVARNTDLGFYTNFVNLLDLSAIAIPNGITAGGFPVGVTLVGPAWHDGLIAAFAANLQGRAGLKLGATGHGLAQRAKLPNGKGAYPHVEIAVFGAHLSGQPLNPDLLALGGVLRRSCLTAPVYRMKLLSGSVERPALVHVGPGKGVAIEGEVWALPSQAVGSFLSRIAPPLGLGTIQLEDESAVTGFICDHSISSEVRDVSMFRSWRAYRDAVA